MHELDQCLVEITRQVYDIKTGDHFEIRKPLDDGPINYIFYICCYLHYNIYHWLQKCDPNLLS